MINRLIDAIKDSQKIVFFSGAGMSTASGIPDFRSSSGLYKNVYRAEEMVSHTFYVKYPEDFFIFYKDKLCYPDAKPNYGHKFIAELERTKEVSVVTQNIDGLHQAAGSNKVYELHGSIHRNYCTKCGKQYPLAYILNYNGVPYCDCGGRIKPDVVLYEEGLDDNTVYQAITAIRNADLLIILGTSLNVYPAANFINYFKGKHLAIINKTPTPKDDMCDIILHEDINEIFKKISKSM